MEQKDHKKPIVVGIGELLWDVFPTGKRAGGAPVNFVFHATQLGAQGYAVSAVGNDILGTEILQELTNNNIAYFIEILDYPTGSVKVELNNGNPTYTIIEDVAWDHIPLAQKAIDIVKKADAICFGTLALRHPDSKNTIETLISYAPENSLRVFDINLRQHYYSKELIEELLKKANVFKINDDEIKTVKGMFSLQGGDSEVCKWFLNKYNLRYVILTAGEKYSVIYSSTEESRIETPRVEVADTVGAGDSFSGAFVYAILTGKTLHQAHEIAVKTAAFVCTKSGAWPAYAAQPCCSK
ncbi:MAG: carbohydrate kinase [Elusimicrobiota bacterium]|jgi:fructokinase|nr:carbohydrate kinase [Elusimicrobiota bacterium]